MADRLDAIIFGATGFTGKYTAVELHKLVKASGTPFKWGIAGRNEDKLKAVLEFIKEKTGDDVSAVPIIVADVGDEDSLKKMTELARIIINCCGPYRFYGEPVVKACIATKTHHVDVSGEPQYMEKIQLEYNKAAQEAGVYIVSACGVDSIPADLGVVFLKNSFEGTVNSVETYLAAEDRSNSGGAVLHYGTWESAVYGLAHSNELRALRSQLYPERLPEFKPKLKPQGLIHNFPLNGKLAIPFLGADKSVIQRSQRFFYEHEKKRPIHVQTYVLFKSYLTVFALFIFGMIFSLLTKFSFGRSLLLKFPRFFSGGYASHEGPSEESMKNSHFSVTLIGKGWDQPLAETSDQYTDPPNKTVVVKVSGINPGYGATCVALILSAFTILNEADKMPDNGGVLPPGAAFAKTTLIDKLHKNGLLFEFVSSKVDEKKV